MSVQKRAAVLNIGGDGRDFLRGSGITDVMFGRGGDDILDGGKGRDLLFAGEGADVVLGGAGDDLAFGGAGDDRMFGESGRDSLSGGEGVDEIDGGRGADLISGGLGADRLTGGKGGDAFAYASGEGGDVIVDFDGSDSFLLDAASFGATGPLAVVSVGRDGEGTDAGLTGVTGGANVYLLQGGFQNAGAARDALAAALAGTPEDEGAGFFVYFNVNLGVARLFHTADLDTTGSTLQQLANLGDNGSGEAADVAALSAANFAFGETLFA